MLASRVALNDLEALDVFERFGKSEKRRKHRDTWTGTTTVEDSEVHHALSMTSETTALGNAKQVLFVSYTV